MSAAVREANPAARTLPTAKPAGFVGGRRCACGNVIGADARCERCRARPLRPALSEPSQPRANAATLPAGARGALEQRFGMDFADVRIHTDGGAAREARALGARAFTRDQEIYFGAGAYAPETSSGLGLLAHELTHVAQQRAGRTAGGDVGRSARTRSKLEVEAERNELSFASGTTIRVRERAAGGNALRSPDFDDALRAAAAVSLELALSVGLTLLGPLATPLVAEALALREALRGSGRLWVDHETAAQIEEDYALLRSLAPSWLTPPALQFGAPAALQQGPLVIPEAMLLLVMLFMIIVLIWWYLQQQLRRGTPGPDIEEAVRRLLKNLRKAKPAPDPQPKPDPKPKPGPLGPDIYPDVNCRKPWEPCPHPLSVSWPHVLPEPPADETLIRTGPDVRESEGVGDRGPAQIDFGRRIREARTLFQLPPHPCFDNEDHREENAVYDAHHIHPIYLGGEDVEENLCALRHEYHQSGHPLLDNQLEHMGEYLACRICDHRLSRHPDLQEYQVVGQK